MVTEAPRPNADEAAADGVGSIRLLEGDPLDPLVQSQCSLSVQLRRATGSIVARSTELQSIAQSIRPKQSIFPRNKKPPGVPGV